MQHAWLDSLTEDWVPEDSSSEPSEPELPALPLKRKLESPPISSPSLQSRIPRRSWTPGSDLPSSHSPTHDSSVNILGERNANDLNIVRQQFDTQLSQGEKASGGRILSLSDGSYGSVVHHTVQHQYRAAANMSATPEWKRRIVYGDVQYGEHVDLFCSAKTGLQDMFKPPQPDEVDEDIDQTEEQSDTTMPSSPPIPRNLPTNDELEHFLDLEDEEDEEEYEEEDDDDDDDGAEYPDQVTPSPSPRRPQREVRYKLNAGDCSYASFMSNDSLRRISIFDRKKQVIFQDFGGLSVPNDSNTTSRKTSGDTRNEHLSPIFLEKHNDEDGNMDFTPMEMSADELYQRLERLRLSQMVHAEPESPTSVGHRPGPRIPRLGMSGEYLYEGDSSNIMRGKRSDEPSSRQRSLSPELGVDDSSEMLPEESLQASTPKQFPTVKSEQLNQFLVDVSFNSPLHLRAPHPSPEKKQVPQTATGQSASSPLKLFGPYDTFTNQTLLRRISQFEEALSDGQASTQSSIKITSSEPAGRPSLTVTAPRQRVISQFGGGDLEGYEFSGDLPYPVTDESGSPGKEDISPRSPMSPGISFEHLSHYFTMEDDSELQARRRRRKPTFLPGLKRIDLSPPNEDSYMGGTPRHNHGSDKRPRTSPSKDSTPKRRRTLHRSDIAFGNDIRLAGIASVHRPIQLLMTKKGKEASRLTPLFVDGPILPRKSTRPNTYPPNRRAMLLLDEERSSTMNDYEADDDSEKSLSLIMHDNDEKAAGNQSGEGTRKPSIRTQDFVDQAAQIMAMIRNQVSQPSLASLVESEGESGLAGQMEASQMISDDDSTDDEPLSRPPSREGNFVSWLPTRQEDPKLQDRLKKYQEMSDMGDIISSSVRSMNLAKDAIRAAQEIEKMIEDTSRSGSDERFTKIGRVISGMANIPVVNSSTSIHEPDSLVQELHSDSSVRLTSQHFHSGSSRGSESRRIIMPESVSHLIPDNVAGMYLDKQNNIWIKKKEGRPSTSYVVSYDESDDDDPFASIPDLTVDMTKEMEQLKSKGSCEDSDENDYHLDTSFEGPSFGQLHEDCTHQARDSGMAARAVQELKKLDPSVSRSSNLKNGRGQHLGSQGYGAQYPALTTRKRNLTISFSSPIASIIQDMLPEDLDSLDDDPDMNKPMADVARQSSNSPPPPLPPTILSDSRNLSRLPVRSRNPRGQNPRGRAPSRRSFIPRPVSRIDEQDEEDTVELSADNGKDHQVSIIKDRSLLEPNAHDASLTFVLNRTPAGKSLARQADDSLLIGQNIGRLSLTPLSEFTIHHPDQSFGLEVSYVMGQRHMATGNGSKRVLSMTIRDLVDKLAEVEPFEPYWEDMTSLDLHNKQLSSLHMLDEFCSRVTVLNASENALAHLEGIPPCVRQLKVSHNLLTELTSWDHLLNLQYVDISGNEIKSLSALRSLVHLRSLRADNNRLTSLDGLDSHDGLLSLRARHNLIEELNAENLKFDRLTELDLESNLIASVTGLESLPSLAQMNLSDNRLASLSFHKKVHSLRLLSVNDNELTSIDIRNLPNLQTLHLDGNEIQELSGLRHVRRIDSLSLREQRTDSPLDLGFLSSACEVRKLFLSGNFLKTFKPRSDFLNLQLLELANCGLSSLPADLGQMMPNLRALNLNFNALSDLTPLRFIPRLKKLFVAGNRLVDSTLVTELLTDFPHLTELDLRDNPMTQGFYPPLQVLVTAERTGSVDRFSLSESDLERDAWFSRLLDEPTKLRRRLHEVVFVASCKRLRKLDGLGVSRGHVLARDHLLQTLIDEGLVPELEDTLVAESESASAARYQTESAEKAEAVAETEEPQSSRWNAEDSFA